MSISAIEVYLNEVKFWCYLGKLNERLIIYLCILFIRLHIICVVLNKYLHMKLIKSLTAILYTNKAQMYLQRFAI